MAYEKFTGEEYIDTDLVAKLNQDFDACGKLASNNTWTGNNYWNDGARFNANLTIRGSATTPGDVSTYLWLGTQPEGSEQIPSICRNKIGDLIMYAADYRPCYLRSGIQTSFASVYNSDGTVEFSSLNNTPWGKYTNANGLELTVHKTPTVNNDVPNKKYVDDSIADAVANGGVNSAKYLNITNFIPSNSDFNDYKTPGEYQVQSNTEANTIANLPTSYNDATPRGGVLSVLIGFNAPRTSLVQIYRTYGSSYVVSRTYQRCFYHENSSWTAWREIAYADEVGLLNQANTYTALNIYRANIAVSNGTTAGSQGQIILGVKPSAATVQANIIASTTGALNYNATENTGHYFNQDVYINQPTVAKTAFYRAIRTDKGTEVAFGIDDGGLNHGVWSGKLNRWIVYANESSIYLNGNALTATKLETARTITANLASSTAGSFDGSANITVGVTGTLPIANGGTGLTSAPSMLVNLASTTATSPLQASPRPGVAGTLPIANGGTGQTTAAGVRNALGLGNTTGAVPIANGGTGATTAAAARTALGCAPAYTYSTTDLTAGSSALTTGTLYIVYE